MSGRKMDSQKLFSLKRLFWKIVVWKIRFDKFFSCKKSFGVMAIWKIGFGKMSGYPIIEWLHRGDDEYSRSRSLKRSSHHYSTTFSSFGYFKIVSRYDSVWEVENVENRNLLDSSFLDSRAEGPPDWDLLRVKNWGWAVCDVMCD